MLNDISVWWKIVIFFFRFFRGSNKCPEYIYKLSQKYFGKSDDLARYWILKYNKVSIGKYTYGYKKLVGSSYLKSINSYTSIGEDVIIVANSHNYNFVTTSPILYDNRFNFGCKNNVLNSYCENLYRSVEIGNDVWIGSRAIIFNGVKIGDGAVIAAGSIIRKDVPPYSIVVGVDKIIKYRFEKEKIKKLLELKWWEWDEAKIKNELHRFYNIDDFLYKR